MRPTPKGAAIGLVAVCLFVCLSVRLSVCHVVSIARERRIAESSNSIHRFNITSVTDFEISRSKVKATSSAVYLPVGPIIN